nr:hypothetical protein [Niabella hibiscisoli]
MEVLKDAAATTIYGASGANGVILITTKRGKVAPPSISVTTWYGVQNNIGKMDMLNTEEWAKLQIDNKLTAATYTNPNLYPPIITAVVMPSLITPCTFITIIRIARLLSIWVT